MTPIEDGNELLLRQVHPNFIMESCISSQVFLPTDKDDKKLSVNRSSMISAREAFDLHTKGKKLQSAGVWGVSVEEVLTFDSLSIESDPIEAPIEDRSYSLINFSKLPSESRIKATAKQLTAKARDRDCLYKPDYSP
jgi:hypothetical protein